MKVSSDNHQHGGHEDAGDGVGQPLDRRLGALRLLDQADDARQHGLRADARSRASAAAPVVDRRADQRVARASSRPAGSRRSASTRPRRTSAREHDAVGRDLLAGAHDQLIADDAPARAGRSRSRPSRSTWATVARSADQRADGLAGLALGARLQVFAQVDQRDDQRGGVVEGRVAPTTGARWWRRRSSGRRRSSRG